MDRINPTPKNLDQVRALLQRMDSADQTTEARAAVWLDAYDKFGVGDEDRFHKLAYEEGLAGATFGRWRYPSDPAQYQVHGPGSLLSLQESRYYQGYEMSVLVEQQSDDGWCCSASVRDSRFRTTFKADLGKHRSLEAAYASGMTMCKHEIDKLINGPTGHVIEGVTTARHVLDERAE